MISASRMCLRTCLWYACDRTVASVPITPTTLFFVALAAALAPGLITPNTGIPEISAFTSSKASAEAVLQAMISALIPFFVR